MKPFVRESPVASQENGTGTKNWLNFSLVDSSANLSLINKVVSVCFLFRE